MITIGLRPLPALLTALAFMLAGLVSGALPAGAGPAAADDYADKRTKIAIVISVSAYPIRPLANTTGDAALITDRLQKAGFAVESSQDAPLAALTPFVQTFLDRAKTADIALVYYAGHAVQIDGENYFVPVDFSSANPDIIGGLYGVRKLLEGLNGGAKAKVLLLDACRDNPFQKRLQEQLGARASGEGLAPISMPVVDARGLPEGTHGLVVSYATQPTKVAKDGKAGEGGPYAKALAKELENPDGDFNAMLVRTTRNVMAATTNPLKPDKPPQQPEHRMALTGPLYLVSRPKPLECDVLAAEPDNDMSVAGVDFEAIDIGKALPACAADLAKNPDSPRLMHNYAKTLERSGKLTEAVALYRQSAERGYDWAQVYYGVAHMEGTGVTPDMKEGIAWMRKAFEQGNRQALVTYTELNLARAFDNKPWRVKLLQQALRDTGQADVPDTDEIDAATSTALNLFASKYGIEGKAITFQLLDTLGIVEALFPKKKLKPEGTPQEDQKQG